MERWMMLALLALPVPSRAAAQLSPGPLARPHAGLAGPTRCLSCHQVNRKASMDGACLACHRELTGLLEARRGLHAREGASRCASCHPDHAGADFALVSWTEDSLRRFDHRRAGWSLEGAHARTKCRDCHQDESRTDPGARLAPGARPAAWTGLGTGCATCHEDVHRNALGGRCANCHDASRWGPAPGFSHDRTEYPLTGAHRDVECTRCHAAVDGRPDPGFPKLARGDCAACHRDPHAGRLTGRCGDCHVTSGFADRRPGGFNHARTRYPLQGRHAAVRCESCHRAGDRQPAFATCGACHEDAHAGTATLGGQAADCAACHDEGGFAPATFTVARHARTSYPLEGEHARVACQACHTRPASLAPSLDPARVQLRPGHARCGSCHADPHRGETAKAAQEGECSACHQVTGWTRTTFTASRHAEFGFPLTGRHATTTCGSCHVPNGKAVFRLTTVACVACHLDPHDARYEDCEACHTADRFRPSTVTAASHREYGLPLEGAHAAVPCVGCHQDLGRPPAGPALRRAAAPAPAAMRLETDRRDCQACHEDRHAGQFAVAPVRACEACHDVDAFRPAARFDHGRQARFTLDGRHAAVACTGCHTDGRYRGTPAACEACHR